MKVVAKPIDVIATFDKEGKPTPIRFRFEKDDGSVLTIRIDAIRDWNIERFGGNKRDVFKCRSNINSQVILYELKFEHDTCKWTLFKI